MKKVILTIALLSCFAALKAQGFVPCGGYAGNTEFALETVASGFAANESSVLSHGIISNTDAASSGIIAVESATLTAAISADGNTITVQGADGTVRADIFAIDGRAVLSAATGADGSISLTTLAPGHYIVRISTAVSAPFVKRFIKRQ